MGSAPEASSGRIRYHLRRPIPGRGELLTRNARNTVKEIVPFRFQRRSVGDGWGHYGFRKRERRSLYT